MDEQATFQEMKSNLANRWWRLNNLYYIKNKTGEKVIFKPNFAQTDFYKNLHYFNAILKARQLGFTTFAMIYFLDACLFNSNHTAGVIAHTQNDANDLFDNKIRYAYNNLPEQIKAMVGATSDNARMLEFTNGSKIYTGTSLRSGTLQKLLISEYGKIGAKYPEKAREIKTGALNTVEQGQQIFVESTAEGKKGEFYDLCERARKLQDSNTKLARMQPKFFFYPWWRNSEYAANDEETANCEINSDYQKYFEELAAQDIQLNDNQKAWYVIKAEQQGDDMSQEFPSTPDEAFRGTLKGAFYAKEMKKMRDDGRILNIPYNPKYPVYTWWDLGVNDLMTCTFTQYIDGWHDIIDYHEASGEGWDYFASMLTKRGYNYAQHGLPHDGNKRIRGKVILTDKQMAESCGIRPIKITPRTNSVINDIRNNCKPTLARVRICSTKAHKLIDHLDNYQRKWSKADSMFTDDPLHDEASHGADSYRTFAMNAEKVEKRQNDHKPKSAYDKLGSHRNMASM